MLERTYVDSLAPSTPATRRAPSLTVSDLPEDVFVLILDNLQIWDAARCALVSRAWRRAFTKLEHIKTVLRRYPNARDVPSDFASQDIDWAAIFSDVARRYFHLSHGLVHDISRHKISPSEQTGFYYPVGQWDYHESQPGGRLYYENAATHLSRLNTNGAKPYLFRPTLWSYDDGLVVFVPAERGPLASPDEIFGLLDLTSNTTFRIPFSISGKVIRNLRLSHRTLIVEWAERDPFHDLNEMEQVNRHFASCFDIKPTGDGQWHITQRSEFKLHFLGLPLNHRDRFFSVHNSEYYAVYFWQPNRSMYTGDEEFPVESLFVWDITKNSLYRPSQDPSGKFRPRNNRDGPHPVARFPFNELDFLGIRQHSNIRFMNMSIDNASATLTWRENTCVAGQGYFDPAERLWNTKSVAFPFLGLGPHRIVDYDGLLPPYRGHASMESDDVEEDAIEKWFLPVMDVVDRQSGVRLGLVETCLTGLGVDNRLMVRVKVPWLKDNFGYDGRYVMLEEDEAVKEVSAMGRIDGDERWVVGQNERMEVVVLRF